MRYKLSSEAAGKVSLQLIAPSGAGVGPNGYQVTRGTGEAWVGERINVNQLRTQAGVAEIQVKVTLTAPWAKPNWCNCDFQELAQKSYAEFRYPIADRYLAPPGDVAAYRSGEAVEVHWDPPMAARTVYTEGIYLKSRSEEYQFKGYAVYQTVGGGQPELVGTVDAGTTWFRDPQPPAGNVAYAVRSLGLPPAPAESDLSPAVAPTGGDEPGDLNPLVAGSAPLKLAIITRPEFVDSLRPLALVVALGASIHLAGYALGGHAVFPAQQS